MQIGIIGFGRLGKLIVKYLSQDADVLVYDIQSNDEEIKKYKASPASLEQVSKAAIVIPSVPISKFRDVLSEITPYLGQNTLVVDVCSVKERPVEWMKEVLPPHVSILGTHPMFGPDSARETLFGTKIVLCPVRIRPPLFNNIKSYLQGHGIKVIEATAQEHDKQIAHSLLLTHFIGRGLIDFKAAPLDIETKGYRRLIKILQTVENDSWQLFEDMNKYNPYADETRAQFMGSLDQVNERLDR